jgi:hypothetical protein
VQGQPPAQRILRPGGASGPEESYAPAERPAQRSLRPGGRSAIGDQTQNQTLECRREGAPKIETRKFLGSTLHRKRLTMQQ